MRESFLRKSLYSIPTGHCKKVQVQTAAGFVITLGENNKIHAVICLLAFFGLSCNYVKNQQTAHGVWLTLSLKQFILIAVFSILLSMV